MHQWKMTLLLLSSLGAVVPYEPALSGAERDTDVEIRGNTVIYRGPPNGLSYGKKFHDNSSACLTGRLTIDYTGGDVRIGSSDERPVPIDANGTEMRAYLGDPGCQISVIVISYEKNFHESSPSCVTEKLTIDYSEGKVKIGAADGRSIRLSADRAKMRFYLGEPGCQISVTLR